MSAQQFPYNLRLFFKLAVISIHGIDGKFHTLRRSKQCDMISTQVFRYSRDGFSTVFMIIRFFWSDDNSTFTIFQTKNGFIVWAQIITLKIMIENSTGLGA